MNSVPAKSAPRRWPLIAGSVIVVLIIVLALLRHFMQPELLSATLLAEAEAATGLSLKLAAPADVSLWPDLNIAMRGLEARSETSSRPLLVAERVELALPWSALWGSGVEITALRLVRPQLDREALAAWLAARPSRDGPAAPPRLPRLNAELRIIEGAVRSRSVDAWQLTDIELSLSSLLPGEEFRLSLAFDYRKGDLQIPLVLDAAGRLHANGMPIELAPLALRWPELDADDQLRLNGQLELAWPHRMSLSLSGSGRSWPDGWPKLPAAPSGTDTRYEIEIEFRGTPGGAGPLSLRFERGGLRSELQADAAALLDWLSQPGQRLLPPARATAELPHLDLKGLTVEGLRITLDEDALDEQGGPDEARPDDDG